MTAGRIGVVETWAFLQSFFFHSLKSIIIPIQTLKAVSATNLAIFLFFENKLFVSLEIIPQLWGLEGIRQGKIQGLPSLHRGRPGPMGPSTARVANFVKGIHCGRTSPFFRKEPHQLQTDPATDHQTGDWFLTR